MDWFTTLLAIAVATAFAAFMVLDLDPVTRWTLAVFITPSTIVLFLVIYTEIKDRRINRPR